MSAQLAQAIAPYVTMVLALGAFVWRELGTNAHRDLREAQVDGVEKAEAAEDRGAFQTMLEEFRSKFDRAFDAIEKQGDALQAHLVECAELRGEQTATQKRLVAEVAGLGRRFDRYDAANHLEARGLANRTFEISPSDPPPAPARRRRGS